MKKSLLLIPLIVVACKKEPAVTVTKDKDSTVVTEMPDSVVKTDSVVLRKKIQLLTMLRLQKKYYAKGS
jgi:hypothetical protein